MAMLASLLAKLGVGFLLRGGEQRAVQQVKQLIAGMARANELGLVGDSMRDLKRAGKRIGEHVAKHSVPTDDELKQMLQQR